MKNFIIFLIGVIFSISANAQNVFMEIPQVYWDMFKIDEALQKANNGDAESQFMLACYYTDITPDNTKFKYWIEKAAENNHSEALCIIAQLYFIGDYGFPVNEAKAQEYARKAASLNNIKAIGMMAEAYKYGMLGLSKDDCQAAYWFEKGARLGDAYCQERLGTMYRQVLVSLKMRKRACIGYKKAQIKNILMLNVI